MVEPQKPFACTLADCGMSFTNEDHLHVHTKKHDMVLQLGLEQKTAFVADQTPTPTRFIRNCEEVGLFQDLQNAECGSINPFDEGFKRAMETKHGILNLESLASSDDVLHTPQMVFPHIDAGDGTTSVNRNVTISRLSSEENSTTKVYEAATISKLADEVSSGRSAHKLPTDEVTLVKNIENDATKTTNDITKSIPVRVYTDANVDTSKNVLSPDNNKLQVDKIPIMSQKSLEFVLDSLTTNLNSPNNNGQPNANTKIAIAPCKRPVAPETVIKKPKIEPKNSLSDYEVIIKLPDGKQVRMQAVNEEKPNAKEVLKQNLTVKQEKKSLLKPNILKRTLNATNINAKKVVTSQPFVANVVKIPTGTLIPVTLVNQSGNRLPNDYLSKLPIRKLDSLTNSNAITPVKTVNPPTTPVKSADTAANVNDMKSFQIQNYIFKMVNKLVKDDLSGERNPQPTTSDANDTIADNQVKIAPRMPVLCINGDGNLVANETNFSNNAPKIAIKPLVGNAPAKNDELIDMKLLPNNDDAVEFVTEAEINERLNGSCEETPEVVMTVEASNTAGRSRHDLMSKCAASKRYRDRLKIAMRKQSEENKQLRESNQRLIAEKAVLKLLITEHMKRCPDANDLVTISERLLRSGIEYH